MQKIQTNFLHSRIYQQQELLFVPEHTQNMIIAIIIHIQMPESIIPPDVLQQHFSQQQSQQLQELLYI